MNDFTVKPVAEFPAYFKGAGDVILGIPADAVSPDQLSPVNATLVIGEHTQLRKFDQFFTSNSVLYFRLSLTFPPSEEGAEPETVVKYCSQEGGKVSYLTEAEFPAAPEMERLVFEDGTVSASVGEYNGDAISIMQRDYEEKLVFVEGVFRVESGYLVSVQEGRGPSRPDGLLFWPDGLRLMTKWKDRGRLYVR